MFSLHKTLGGVHPPQCKDTRECATVVLDPPKHVRIPLNMHIGGPDKPTVTEGDHVYVGTCIGDGQGLCAPIHASVSGTVTAIQSETLPTGQTATVVEIDSDGKMEPDPELKAPTYETTEEFLNAARASGMVGLGGASFPTWFKMKAPAGKNFEYLLINGMECEPYLTSDFRQMIEHTERVIAGVERVAKALGIKACCIGVENNKPEAQDALDTCIKEKGLTDLIEVLRVPVKYPAGGEKVFIEEATGRQVPAGGLPADVGCLVMNVTTVSMLEEFFRTGMPLVYKVVTLCGDCPVKPGNYQVPIGTSVEYVVEATGGFATNPHKVIMGGPMMGRTISDVNCPILKANNGILCIASQAILPDETPCIRCGRCVRSCPLGLMPFALDEWSRAGNVVKLDEFAVMNCMECGSCSFACPAHRRITAHIHEGKGIYRSETKRLTQPAKEA